MIKREKCLDCHDNEEPVTKEASNKKLMHEEHVAGQNASCFNCHKNIEHDKNGDPLDIARTQCQECQNDPQLKRFWAKTQVPLPLLPQRRGRGDSGDRRG